MSDPARARKLADRIKVVVAETLERRIKDPRLGFVTVTDARVTGDLQHATVYYTVLGEDADKASTATALESAKGVIRSQVGKQTGIRLTPTITFVPDEMPENADAIEDLLRRAQEQDEQVAALAAGAAYAGDADPYRRPEEEHVDDELDPDQNPDQDADHADADHDDEAPEDEGDQEGAR